MGVWGKLQALVYDIIPLEEGAGKRSSECGSGGGGGKYFGTRVLFVCMGYLSFDPAEQLRK